MSNTKALSAVTSALQWLLQRGAIPKVTTLPPDAAHKDNAVPRVNLFLFQSRLNAAWVNGEYPGAALGGEAAPAPLPLVLSYLVTALGGTTPAQDTEMLAEAMLLLHDNAILSPAEIQSALAGSDFATQIEKVRITPQPLPVDEISKLWMVFQAPYRLSVAYEVSVVLLRSRIPAGAPLPVLRRGSDDRGPVAAADATLPFVRSAEAAGGRNVAVAGDRIVVRGDALPAPATLRLEHPLADPVELPATAADDGLTATLPPAGPAALAAGVWSLTVLLPRPGGAPDGPGNVVPLAVAPVITLTSQQVVTVDGAATIGLTVAPPLLAGQRVALLLGDRVLPVPVPLGTASVSVTVPDAPLGSHTVRLRVDLTDTFWYTRTTPPAVDPAQVVTVVAP
ncbi:DUF4255 domain-containing protein [Actinoplanes sp. CA-030573]|uniref:DUF4255 domain-containing protein n=1 Tax=Actinoplanes sp. CA-030573 TaxID=3239898 RepID=UPI003D8DCA2E